MRKRIRKILVTGGAGFIGSAFVRLLAKTYAPAKLSLVVVDKLTYAGDLTRLEEAKGRYKFYKADISNKSQIQSIFKRERPVAVVNFAAESHVDRSICDSAVFVKTNVAGTDMLLRVSREYSVVKFIQVSTDEVYGEIANGSFDEDSPFNPSSPYSASKAAADLLINSYIRTYSFPAIIVRPSNNYGPWQYPEKLIPLAILKVLRKEKIPVYGRGQNIREWLYVDDCVKGILAILESGRVGSVYNIGSDEERRNIDIVMLILKEMHASNNLIEFVKDRPGHDLRYRLNSDKIRQQLHWMPEVKPEEGIRYTVRWCLAHKDWLMRKWSNIAWLYRKNVL
ncbi:MAG: dTDP-glucose 4,6-dehydratase [Candidatus Omnitrophica bacterium]|nr:dTDP-glucose 4,6-dehydratase [Candidatus Omnitrophota bacterium]